MAGQPPGLPSLGRERAGRATGPARHAGRARERPSAQRYYPLRQGYPGKSGTSSGAWPRRSASRRPRDGAMSAAAAACAAAAFARSRRSCAHLLRYPPT